MVVIKSEKIVYDAKKLGDTEDQIIVVKLVKSPLTAKPFFVQIQDHEDPLTEDNSNGFNYAEEFDTIGEAQKYYDDEIKEFKEDLQCRLKEQEKIRDPNNPLARALRKRKEEREQK